MSDTAKLREALHTQGAFSGPRTPEQSNLIYAAAMKYLALKEAGALIITPDENGKWPEWARQALKRHGWPILDALRDAMPDGET